MNNKGLATTLVAVVVLAGVAGIMYYGTQKSATDNLAQTSSSVNQNSSAPAPTVRTIDNVVVSNSTALVTGQVNPNGSPTTYWYEYGLTTALENRANTQSLGSGSGRGSIIAPGYITGLQPNTTYFFRLSAMNKTATVHGTTYTFTTNNNPPAASAVPTLETLVPSGVTGTSAILNGSVNPSGFQTLYWFEYGTDADLGEITKLESVGKGTDSVAVSPRITDLRPQTKYFFRLNAQNAYGTVNGSVMSFTTTDTAAN